MSWSDFSVMYVSCAKACMCIFSWGWQISSTMHGQVWHCFKQSCSVGYTHAFWRQWHKPSKWPLPTILGCSTTHRACASYIAIWRLLIASLYRTKHPIFKCSITLQNTPTSNVASLYRSPHPHSNTQYTEHPHNITLQQLNHILIWARSVHKHVPHRKSHVHTCYQIWQLAKSLTLHFSKQQTRPVLFFHTTMNTTMNITARRTTTSRGNPM